jgi:DNA repair exonuclease SbcCD nuclease subunit
MTVKFAQQKICCIADLHFGVHQNNPLWHSIAMNWATWLRDELKKKKVKDIFISGDFFHYRSEIAVNTIHLATDILTIWKSFNIVILIGNHDSYYKDRIDVNSLSILNGWKNITVIEKPEQINSFDRDILFCPWGTKVEELVESDIIFGHFEIESFKMNHFKVCTEGIKSKDLLNNCDLIMSGHFHHRDERQYKTGKIIYLGNPYQMDFGDVECTKGYYILDIPSKTYEFFENTISPKHKKVFLSKLVKYPGLNDEVKKIFANNIVKFIIDRHIAPDEIEYLLSKFSGLDAVSITTDYAINFDKFGIDDQDTSGISGVDIPTAIEEFINLLDIEDKTRVIEHTLDLYRKSK